jgi:hypothetical protein
MKSLIRYHERDCITSLELAKSVIIRKVLVNDYFATRYWALKKSND